MVKITFYKQGESLGNFEVKQMSDECDRLKVAKENNITGYDEYWLDDGRVQVTVNNDLRIVNYPGRFIYQIDSKGNLKKGTKYMQL